MTLHVGCHERTAEGYSGVWPTTSQRGFTLLELLVAVAVFAAVSAVAYTGLGSILETRQQTERHAQALQALQQALTIVERDLVQATRRPVRDPYGTPEPAMYQTSDHLLRFTSDGRMNLQGQRQSQLRRIAYALEDGRFVRYLWPVLDATAGEEPYRVALLEGVRDAKVRFLDENLQWHEYWPPAEQAYTAYTTPLPRAVELTLELAQWERIRRLVPLVEMPAGGMVDATAPQGAGGEQ